MMLGTLEIVECRSRYKAMVISFVISCFAQLPRQQPANWQRSAVAGACNLGAAVVGQNAGRRIESNES
jgi:hypothetical protein